MSLKDKVVIVTGSSSNIGAATVIKFAQEGAKVVIVGRNENDLRDVAQKCEAAGSKPLVITADLTNDEDLTRIVSSTINHFEKIDILVNNAGFEIYEDILHKNANVSFDKIIATNLRAPAYLMHLVAPYLIETKGNIINISSIAGQQLVLDNAFAYITSKAGLDHFTRSVALELGPKGIRVNSVNPGLVRTPIIDNIGKTKSHVDAVWKSFEKSGPRKKIAEAEEVADLIVYIASDNARSITGSSFVIDNGELMVPSSCGNNE